MNLAQRIAKLLPFVAQLMMKKKWEVVVAESCSGGALSAALTSIPGSSTWFDHGIVTYSNTAKIKFLDVSPQLLDEYGAVSKSCALAMVQGLQTRVQDFCLAITGFAGPDGDEIGKVYLAWLVPNHTSDVKVFYFQGTREQIIKQVVYQALRQMIISSIYPLDTSFHCFFALEIEDVNTQKACLDVGLQIGFNIDELEPMNNLHMTLSYLGQQGLNELKTLKKIGDSVHDISIFDLQWSACEPWERANCLVLTVSTMPKMLVSLMNQLPKGSEKHPFTPHVTIAKRHHRKITSAVAVDISYRVKTFSLMLSFQGVFYISYLTWTLKKEGEE